MNKNVAHEILRLFSFLMTLTDKSLTNYKYLRNTVGLFFVIKIFGWRRVFFSRDMSQHLGLRQFHFFYLNFKTDNFQNMTLVTQGRLHSETSHLKKLYTYKNRFGQIQSIYF